MAGGNDINNELTLNVSNFTSGLEQATKKLDSLNTKLDGLDSKSNKLEKDLQGLGANAKQTSDKLGAVTNNLDGLAGGLDRAHKKIGKASDGSSRLKQDLSELAKQARTSDAAMASFGDWTKFYGKSLDALRPKMNALITSQKELASITKDSTKAEARSIQNGLHNRIRVLSEERKLNDERIKARKSMVGQLDLLERRAEARAAFAHADAFKTKSDGTLARRYIGKNAGRHKELMAEIDAYKKEAEAIRQQKSHISAIVGEMQYRNGEISKAIRGEQSLLEANKQTLKAVKEQREEVARLAAEKKQAAAQEKELAKQVAEEQKKAIAQKKEAEKKALAEKKAAEKQAAFEQKEIDKKVIADKKAAEKQALAEKKAAEKQALAEKKAAEKQAAAEEKALKKQAAAEEKAIKKQALEEEKAAKKLAATQEKELARQVAAEQKAQAKAKAQAEKQAQQEILLSQRQAHKEVMQMRKEELAHHREMAGFATGAAVGGATAVGVKQAATYQDVLDRLRAYNFEQSENAEIMARVDRLTANNRFLSRTDALQGNIDAISAIGYNKADFIEKTLEPIMRDAFILKAKGYDSADLSDIIKNIYAVIEKRGLASTELAAEAVNASDIARRMVVASGGKFKMADYETVLNNIGAGAMTISDDGWLRLLPLMEQSKTAGGGNGGGGGVARVGTMIKMLQLIASGRKITNRAALDFMGANMMNEIYADGASQDFAKTQQTNNVMMQAMTRSGFKNQEQIARDPVAAVQAMRGGILDYMMQGDKFAQYFGPTARKHSYNKEGKMIDADGKMVGTKRQTEIENAAFMKFFAPSGISNNNVTALMTLMNQTYAERAEHSVATAKNTKGREELLQDLSNNWNSNIQQLKAQLANLAISFEPLLTVLTKIPSALADIVSGLASFGSANPILASLAAGFLGLKVASFALAIPLRAVGTLFSSGAKSGSLLKGVLGGLAGIFTTVSTSSGKTGADLDNLKNKASGVGDGAKKGFGGFLASALGASGGVRGAIGNILRIVGLAVSWVGWAALAAMFASVIIKWLADVNVGGIRLGNAFTNMIGDISTSVKNGLTHLSEWMGWLFNKIGMMSDQSLEKIRRNAQLSREANNLQNEEQKQGKLNLHATKVRDATDNAVRKIMVAYHSNVKKAGTRADTEYLAAYQNYMHPISPQDIQAKKRGELVAPSLPNSPLGRQAQATIDGLYKRQNATLARLEKQTAPPKNQPKVEATPLADINGFHAGSTTPLSSPLDTAGAAGKNGAKGTTPRQEFVPQNAYDVSIAGLKLESAKDQSRIDELLGHPADYDFLARQSFIKEWMSGKLDDGRDPSSRPFANRAYSKGRDWAEADINWTDPKVQQWVALKQRNLQNDGTQKSLEFVAGKLGEASEKLDLAFDEWNNDTDTPSNERKASIEFGRFERKNPASSLDPSYTDIKNQTLAKIAAAQYAEMGKELRDQNRELDDQRLENETKANRNSEKRRYESEEKKVKAVIKSLDDNLMAVKTNYGEESNLYKDLLNAKIEAESQFTDFLKNQDDLRVRNTRSAYDQTMAQWRDLETNVNKILGSFGERAATDIWDIFNEEKILDISGYTSDLLKGVGESLFKSAWGGLSKQMMGEGEQTNVLDYARNILSGGQANESGAIGRWLNSTRESGGFMSKVFDKIHNTFGKFFNIEGGAPTELTGDQATNANTSALERLTAAIQGLLGKSVDPNFATPVAIEDAYSDTQSFNVGIANGLHAVDVVNGNGPMLDSLIGSVGMPSQMNEGNFSYAFGSLGAEAEGAVQVGMIDKVKAGFSNLFSSTGEGGVFTGIKDGFSNLFSRSGGLMNGIGAVFNGLFSNIGSIVTNLFGGGTNAQKAGSIVGGAAQGYAGGGWAGAAAGAVAGAFANGGAFGTSGQIHAFANGGAFTNDIYNSPTLFKFAKGGQFGVMGEAGPEAVMPLQRDSSGRLGVAVNGGMMGGDSTAVNIEINVTNNGDDSKESTNSNNNEWGALANKVKSLVQAELVQQKRPGGMLRNTN